MAEVEFAGAVVHILGGVKKAGVPGSVLKQVLENLEAEYPVLAGRLIRQGALSSLYLVYVNGMDARLTEGLDTPVGDGARIKIMNALTGG